MLFRLGLFIGLAIGYVLGAKAGRERYTQIQSLGRQIKRSEPAQQIGDEVRTTASRVGGKIEARASEQVAKITRAVRSNGNGVDTPRALPQA